MGYTTDFSGSISIDKPLTEVQLEYLNALAYTRRMKRDVNNTPNGENELHNRVGLGLGVDGEYYVGGVGGQFGTSESVLDHNKPASTQPGLWCQWIIEDNEITWDGGEKFYNYIAWMEYIVAILDKWGYTCNGEIYWDGEESEDNGKIVVKDNDVKAYSADLVYDDEVEDDAQHHMTQKEFEDLVNASMKKGLELALGIVEGLKEINSNDPRVQVSTVCNSIIVEINKFEKHLSK